NISSCSFSNSDGPLMHGRRARPMATLILLLVSGCGEARVDSLSEKGSERPAPRSCFDPSSAGSIQGVVRWNGPIPSVPAFRVERRGLPGTAVGNQTLRDNPNAPHIDA